MSVYVDPMQPTIPNRIWPYTTGCHLLADTVDELHAFADKILLKRAWFQSPGHALPHYDLTSGKRAQAVKYGAIEIDIHRVATLMEKHREGRQPAGMEFD